MWQGSKQMSPQPGADQNLWPLWRSPPSPAHGPPPGKRAARAGPASPAGPLLTLRMGAATPKHPEAQPQPPLVARASARIPKQAWGCGSNGRNGNLRHQTVQYLMSSTLLMEVAPVSLVQRVWAIGRGTAAIHRRMPVPRTVHTQACRGGAWGAGGSMWFIPWPGPGQPSPVTLHPACAHAVIPITARRNH